MFGDWNYINNVSAGLNSGELIAFVKLFAGMEEWAEKIGLMALCTVVLPSNCIYIDPKIIGSV